MIVPGSLPKASRAQMYGPPSSGKAVPSSAKSKALGIKKTRAKMISHEKAWAPADAMAPIVSIPTSVQIVKKRISFRPKCFCRCCFSSMAAAVRSSPELSILVGELSIAKI